MTTKNPLQRRRAPQQKRSQKRINEILDATARLLAEVGLDDLTTVLIAQELGISVGSVYHYFPNKFAILYTVGERWLEDMTCVLEAVETWDMQELGIDGFVDQYCDEMLRVYHQQISVLPLVQAMFAVPELHELDERHDEIIISGLIGVFKRLGLKASNDELDRVGRLMLEMSHALLLVIVNQNKTRSVRTLEDLKTMLCEYLSKQPA
ncbi:MAG: TetR/AcrR family transcriptional regulator [Proteobacteria bacterium]|nr:TetR/AcrR family transcriptional regulator [Pseudomonadota bacterium]